MRRPSLPVVAAGIVVVATVALVALPRRVERTRFSTSPDGTHLATVARAGAKWIVTLERVGGRPQPVAPPVEVARTVAEPAVSLTDARLEVRGDGAPTVVRLDPRGP